MWNVDNSSSLEVCKSHRDNVSAILLSQPEICWLLTSKLFKATIKFLLMYCVAIVSFWADHLNRFVVLTFFKRHSNFILLQGMDINKFSSFELKLTLRGLSVIKVAVFVSEITKLFSIIKLTRRYRH
jgi:hypothetical protein